MALSVRYMGSKRALASEIAARISAEHEGRAVLDVFAGMCAVGSELAPKHPMLTNDIHVFAQTVAKALFVEPVMAPTSLIAREELFPALRTNRDALRLLVGDQLNKERVALARVEEPSGWKFLFNFHQEVRDSHLPLKGQFSPVSEYRLNNQKFPYSLCTRYFANGYFAIEQAIEIDSLRYAIDLGPREHRSYYLTALIHAVSHCSASPGHFAQFLEPRDRGNTRYIARIRKRSVIDRFLEALDASGSIDCYCREENEAFNQEATQLLTSMQGRSNRSPVIYADPPYSRAQYSRYYHVLETLVLYDYPECDGKGRYRENRFLTDFSRRSGVVSAFSSFIKACRDLDAPLYVSYPANGMLNREGVSLRDLLCDAYPNVELINKSPLRHSTMGGAPGVASVPVFEEVYYARPGRGRHSSRARSRPSTRGLKGSEVGVGESQSKKPSPNL